MKRLALLFLLVASPAFGRPIKDPNGVTIYTGVNTTPSINAATDGTVTIGTTGQAGTHTINGAVSVSGAATVTGNLTVNGSFRALKQYLVGTAYTNGTPSLSSGQAGFATIRAVLVPYQTSDGAWRMKINAHTTWTSAGLTNTAVTSFTITVSGVTFKSGPNQSLEVGPLNSSIVGQGGYTDSNASTIALLASSITASAGCTGLSWGGDVELNSKPTWAD